MRIEEVIEASLAPVRAAAGAEKSLQEAVQALGAELERQLGPALRRDGDNVELRAHSGDALELDLRALAHAVTANSARSALNGELDALIERIRRATITTEEAWRLVQ
jgi:hypothetical protein